MKYKLTSVILLSALAVNAQFVAVDYSKKTGPSLLKSSDSETPQLLKNGFLDFLSDGNMQASAQFVRINIGEPGKFFMPFLVYTGVATQTFGETRLNKTTVANLLNQVSGTINMSLNGYVNFKKDGQNDSFTKLKFAYQIGGRLINGKDSLKGTNVNFFNGLLNAGFYFQTRAWEEGNSTLGVFWIQAKALANISSRSLVDSVFGKLKNNYFIGYSIDAGIEISQVINLKLGVYQYMNNRDNDLFRKPQVKFSVDYKLNK